MRHIWNCSTYSNRASENSSQIYKGEEQSLYFPDWPAAGNRRERAFTFIVHTAVTEDLPENQTDLSTS